MTEAEWLHHDEPDAMLEFVGKRLADRKLLLIVCGCCRVRSTYESGAAYMAEMFEKAADRSLDAHAKMSMMSTFNELMQGNMLTFALRAMSGSEGSCLSLARTAIGMIRQLEQQQSTPQETPIAARKCENQANVVREIVGNPFSQNEFDPQWRTSTVHDLTVTIDDERSWQKLPILADALEDAGCDDIEMLNHCRSEHAIHHRGCWVIDSILGRITERNTGSLQER